MSSMIQIPSSALIVLQPSQFTYEEHFIIRFPPSLAASVRSDLQESGVPGDLEINFNQQDSRLAKVKFDGRTYQAVLCDLPTIIETHKTTDRSQYIKVADVHQVLIVLDGSPESVKQKLDQYMHSDYKLDDGLTAPMKNVRNRRFSKKASENAKRMEDIEAKLKLLLESDERAESTNYTLYDSKNRPIQIKQNKRKTKARVEVIQQEQAEIEYPVEEEQQDQQEMIQGEEGEVEGEESDDSDFAAELEGELLDELDQEEELEFLQPEESQNEDSESIAAEERLPPAILTLKRQIEEKKGQLNSLTNPAIRLRLEQVISFLERQLQDKLDQIE